MAILLLYNAYQINPVVNGNEQNLHLLIVIASGVGLLLGCIFIFYPMGIMNPFETVKK